MNYKANEENGEMPSTRSYFESRVFEEDSPVSLPIEMQRKYESLEILFDVFFDEGSLNFAKHSSKEEREKRKLEDSSFVYGEITFRSLSYIIEFIKAKFGENVIRDGDFLDLGSGVGRGIIAATLIHKFDKYIGIEYLENLHIFALSVIEEFRNKITKLSLDNIPQLQIINDDFLLHDWSSASVVFANSTCFSNDLMAKLSEKANTLKKGTFFVTFTKKLANLSSDWETLDGFRRLMSWGIATVYVHMKIK